VDKREGRTGLDARGGDPAGPGPSGLRVLLVGPDATVGSLSAALQTAGVAAEHVAAVPVAADGYDLVLVASGVDGGLPDSLAGPSRALASATAEGRTAGTAIAFDDSARTVWVCGSRLDLTGREYALLRFFFQHPGHVFTRDELLREVWHTLVLTDGAVTEYIRRLRMHLARHGLAGAIRTRHGFGYCFDPEVSPTPVESVAPGEGGEPAAS